MKRPPSSYEMLVSFADGQLDANDRERVLTLLDMDAELSREVWELRKLKDMVDLSYQDLPELLAPLPGTSPRRRGRLTVVVSIVVLVLLTYLLLLATGLLAPPGT
ncbi:MAG: hypothetical protein WCY26_08150 [Thiohalobacteraceae bacterium]|nr:hypothetical protein [Gammaproteobacteria bacterium]